MQKKMGLKLCDDLWHIVTAPRKVPKNRHNAERYCDDADSLLTQFVTTLFWGDFCPKWGTFQAAVKLQRAIAHAFKSSHYHGENDCPIVPIYGTIYAPNIDYYKAYISHEYAWPKVSLLGTKLIQCINLKRQSRFWFLLFLYVSKLCSFHLTHCNKFWGYKVDLSSSILPYYKLWDRLYKLIFMMQS